MRRPGEGDRGGEERRDAEAVATIAETPSLINAASRRRATLW
jgi:hypothetical protein